MGLKCVTANYNLFRQQPLFLFLAPSFARRGEKHSVPLNLSTPDKEMRHRAESTRLSKIGRGEGQTKKGWGRPCAQRVGGGSVVTVSTTPKKKGKKKGEGTHVKIFKMLRHSCGDRAEPEPTVGQKGAPVQPVRPSILNFTKPIFCTPSFSGPQAE